MRKIYTIIFAFILAGCSQASSASRSQSSDPDEAFLRSIWTQRMFPWEAKFVIDAQEEYQTMDLLVYRLEEGRWKEAESWPGIPLSKDGKYEDILSFRHDNDAFEIDYNNKDGRILYSAVFEKKEEGYSNGYARMAKPAVISSDVDIPIYGLVRNSGNAIKAFSAEGFMDQTEYEEGIVFVLKFHK